MAPSGISGPASPPAPPPPNSILRILSNLPPGAGPERVQRYQAGVAASWELDLFGRLRRATEAQRAELEAAGADLGAVQVAIAGQLASSYFELRGLQEQYQVARQSVALQQQSLDIVEARVKAGRGTEFDQVRARAQLERTGPSCPPCRPGYVGPCTASLC